MQGEGPTFGINGRFGSLEKKFNINFSKANSKFCFMIVVICLLMKKKIFKFKAESRNVNFPTQFCLGSMDLELLGQEKYLSMEMSMIFKSITILLLNLTY